MVAHERAHVNVNQHYFSFAYQDLTNDRVPDVALGFGSFYIFGCRDGKYQTLFNLRSDDAYMNAAGIIEIKDENRDGIPELTLLTGAASQGGHSYNVYEWDGNQFQSLLVPEDPQYPESGDIFVEVTGYISYKDINGDGIAELIVVNGIPVWETYYSGLPYRNETIYYRWDGYHYVSYRLEFEAPQYRFQAVQDGDRLALLGEYDRALDMYQQVIFSDKLEWWSPERHKFLQDEWMAQFSRDSPTPVPPTPDTHEYYYLAAYARYRIMLLDIVRGWLPEAKVVYDTLQEKFPTTQVGHEYAEMAKAFWANYQSAQNIENACSQAIAYATQNSGILTYLGSDYHGWQSKDYKPEDTCPFK